MRAVVDTNILIRALIKPNGSVGPMLTRLADGDFTLIYSDVLLDELLEKVALPRIRNKYDLGAEQIESLLALFAIRAERVVPTRAIAICRDPDDDRVIEAALAGEADVIVTGDEDLLTLKRVEEIEILSSANFLRMLDSEQ
jgi:putative PIN family toxin of toxin-antitoxin system